MGYGETHTDIRETNQQTWNRYDHYDHYDHPLSPRGFLNRVDVTSRDQGLEHILVVVRLGPSKHHVHFLPVALVGRFPVGLFFPP